MKERRKMNQTEYKLMAAFHKKPDVTVDEGNSWVEQVSEHEHPVKNKNIFHEDADKIAKYFSSPKVSPRGLGQAIQKLNFYIQRGKHNLAQQQINKVKKAMQIIHSENEKRKV